MVKSLHLKRAILSTFCIRQLDLQYYTAHGSMGKNSQDRTVEKTLLLSPIDYFEWDSIGSHCFNGIHWDSIGFDEIPFRSRWVPLSMSQIPHQSLSNFQWEPIVSMWFNEIPCRSLLIPLNMSQIPHRSLSNFQWDPIVSMWFNEIRCRSHWVPLNMSQILHQSQ